MRHVIKLFIHFIAHLTIASIYVNKIISHHFNGEVIDISLLMFSMGYCLLVLESMMNRH